jgi:hypothetical protein
MKLTGEFAKMATITPVVFVLIIIGVSSPIFAQVSSEHVVSDVSKLLERGVSDKKMARQIAHLQPTYYLSDLSVEELEQKQRIGPRTLFALHVLASKSIYLDPSPTENRPADAAPDPASAEKLRQSIRTYMAHMLELLPKFTCNRQIRMFANCRGGWPGKTPTVCDEEWHYREDFDPLIEKRMPDTGRVPLGSFRYILDSSLQWKRWDFCDGQKCAVFSYSERTSPYSHGLVFCSPADGTVYRQFETLPTREDGTNNVITEFSPIFIDNNTYWFPTKDMSMIQHLKGVNWLRDVHVFSDYHKLKADSDILYGPPNK